MKSQPHLTCVLCELAGTGHSSGLYKELKCKSGNVPENDMSIRLAKLVVLTHPAHFLLVVCRNLYNLILFISTLSMENYQYRS
jgi:hypothetical protein